MVYLYARTSSSKIWQSHHIHLIIIIYYLNKFFYLFLIYILHLLKANIFKIKFISKIFEIGLYLICQLFNGFNDENRIIVYKDNHSNDLNSISSQIDVNNEEQIKDFQYWQDEEGDEDKVYNCETL